MSPILKIGTRSSPLALWQARYVASALQSVGHQTEIVPITSQGEKDTVTPLYEMGVQGIFTKTLDVALLDKRIDIAVHSMKDVPTRLPEGLRISAIPPRGNHLDLLVYKEDKDICSEEDYTVATSSLRRSAQWKHRYPDHQIVSIRGNVNTRLQKLLDHSDWDAVIFAAAGIERIDLKVPLAMNLNWMVAAPAQGALAIVTRQDDQSSHQICQAIHDRETGFAVDTERKILRLLGGGCTMPFGAYAYRKKNETRCHARLCSEDGARQIESMYYGESTEASRIADAMYQDLRKQGAEDIVQNLEKR